MVELEKTRLAFYKRLGYVPTKAKTGQDKLRAVRKIKDDTSPQYYQSLFEHNHGDKP